MSDRLYILYDERACKHVACGTDSAAVLCTAQDDTEAKSDATMFGNCACYSYDASRTELADRRHEWDFVDKQFIDSRTERAGTISAIAREDGEAK